MNALAILALMLLAGLAPAQTGTLQIPASLTNNVTNLSALLPPLDAGNTRWRISAYSTFDQTLIVTSAFPAPFPVTARFCNSAQITSGAVVLAEAMNRARIDLACDFGTVEGSVASTLSFGGTWTANTQELLGPFTLRNSVRSLVSASIPFGEGSIVHQTISRSATIVEYEGRP